MCLYLFSTSIVEINKFLFYYGKETYAKITSQIYQERESSDSPGSFGFERARKVDFRILSEIY